MPFRIRIQVIPLHLSSFILHHASIHVILDHNYGQVDCLLQHNIKYSGALAISSPNDESPGALSPQDEEHEAYKLRTEKLCTTTAIDLNDTTDTKRADSTDRMHMNNGK
ncbi:hypothetical protein CMEL01_05988 [Colletotrichum melonis]|uniref:Uncharacterized protein n=1 Tax=Colletotrichum melonis TaxID=1209925 RepID=A0AAI9U499_9PEZI|nr:hypothetical protein CMEL01_05988 [Colletotrichum melonis]